MDTEELVVLSRSFKPHSLSVRRHVHLRGHVSRERCVVSTVERRERNLHMAQEQSVISMFVLSIT